MAPSIVDLPWLPPPPADFSAQCRALDLTSESLGFSIQQLSLFRLSARQSTSLARAIKRCQLARGDLPPLSGFRLGILASSTFDLLVDCLPAAAARHGVALNLTTTPYDQVMQQALDPNSAINAARLDAVLIAVDHRWLNLDQPNLTEAPGEYVRLAISRIRTVVDTLRQHGGAPAILQTMPAPPVPLFGNYDRRIPGSVRAMVTDANRAIVSLAEETGSYLLDVATLAEQIGTDRWFDPIQWLSYKLPFSADCFPAYADLLGRMLGAIRGKARKCLVLDLDNTLWGGGVGDDGLTGIHIGHGNPRGEAFLAIQRAVMELRERGIILAICSKNDDVTARGPFREHPDMLLRENHIAAFHANWTDKPSNLEAIAKKLNIGLEALVLLDDNPAERAQVRAALPMVAVPELPEDPSWYPWHLAAAGYFEAVTFSSEDQLRAQAYTSDLQRTEVKAKARDLGDYLASLEMVVRFAPFDSKGRQRIVQLINKTNQFNLTTRRYTEVEVRAMETDKNVFTLQARLADKFGDLGMIGIIICRSVDEFTWDIDTWLMSCRVLGRQVEQAMLDKVAAEAKRRGIRRLVGTYAPTAKNAIVSEHYKQLGFQQIESSGENVTVWHLDLAAYISPKLPMRMEEAMFALSEAAE